MDLNQKQDILNHKSSAATKLTKGEGTTHMWMGVSGIVIKDGGMLCNVGGCNENV